MKDGSYTLGVEQVEFRADDVGRVLGFAWLGRIGREDADTDVDVRVEEEPGELLEGDADAGGPGEAGDNLRVVAPPAPGREADGEPVVAILAYGGSTEEMLWSAELEVVEVSWPRFLETFQSYSLVNPGTFEDAWMEVEPTQPWHNPNALSILDRDPEAYPEWHSVKPLGRGFSSEGSRLESAQNIGVWVSVATGCIWVVV